LSFLSKSRHDRLRWPRFRDRWSYWSSSIKDWWI